MEAASVPADGGTEDGAPEESGDQFAPILERFDGLESQFTDRVAGLEERLEQMAQPQQEEEQEGEFDDFGAAEDGTIDPQQFATQIRDDALKQARQEMEEQLAPIRDAFTNQALVALEAKYPALATEEGAAPVVAAARQAAERYGHPDLSQDPGFLEDMYMAEIGRQQARQEIPAGAQQGGTLESGGAAPQEPQMSPFERMHQERQEPGRNTFGLT